MWGGEQSLRDIGRRGYRLEEEKKFLSHMDSQIDEIAQRLDKHTLPARKTDENGEEIDESSEEEEENYL